MAAIDLKQLVGRLNEPCRRALEAAAGLTLSRTHYNVEIEHWLVKLADRADTDIAAILRHYEVDQGRSSLDLNRALERMKTGNTRAPALAPDIVGTGEAGLADGLGRTGRARIRSGHLLWALLADETLARRAREASGQLLKINADVLKRDFAAITAAAPKRRTRHAAAESGAATASGDGAPMAPRGRARSISYTIDLTAQARAGKIDPILGRDTEIRQVDRHPDAPAAEQSDPDRRGRRRQDGGGRRLRSANRRRRRAAGDCRTSSLRTLDLGLLQAGAGMKGEFENRLKSVIDEVKAARSRSSCSSTRRIR